MPRREARSNTYRMHASQGINYADQLLPREYRVRYGISLGIALDLVDCFFYGYDYRMHCTFQEDLDVHKRADSYQKSNQDYRLHEPNTCKRKYKQIFH